MAHLAAVRAVLYDFGFEEDSQHGVAAWLHDVIEDTKVLALTLQDNFGPDVTNLVWAVSGFGVTRAERSAVAYEKIRVHPPAVILKLADRIANVENAAKTRPDLLEMYRKEHHDFGVALSDLCFHDTVVQVDAMWARLTKAFKAGLCGVLQEASRPDSALQQPDESSAGDRRA